MKKLFLIIIITLFLSSCVIIQNTATPTPLSTPLYTVTPSATSVPKLTITPFYTYIPIITNTPFPTSTPFPTLVPSIGGYQGIGAREITCGEIPLPPNIVRIECYNISGIGGARLYFDSNNKLVAIALTYKFGQGYDAGIFATKTASQYGWNINDLIGLISMMDNTGVLYTSGTISGISEVSPDDTMVYMLISPDKSILENGINID
jgi:hypothetical protein